MWEKENEVLILFSLIPTKTKPGFSVPALVRPTLSPPPLAWSIVPSLSRDTESYAEELIFMLLFRKPKAGGIR